MESEKADHLTQSGSLEAEQGPTDVDFMWLRHKLGRLPQKPSCDRVAVTRFLVTVKGHAHIDFSHFFPRGVATFGALRSADTAAKGSYVKAEGKAGDSGWPPWAPGTLVRIPPFFRVTG